MVTSHKTYQYFHLEIRSNRTQHLYLTDAHLLFLQLREYFPPQNKQAAVFVCTYLTRHIKLHLSNKSFVKNVEMFVLFQHPPF